MGKKQHSKDRMFITKTEWATEWGGAKSRDLRTPFKRLPFYCCALTFVPFEDPVCTVDGHVFDILYIVPYIIKYGKNPVTGLPLALKDLIKLQFHKNSDGEYQCPVLNKVFTEFTHIVAIRTTGNVFSYEAVKELNLKTKNWKELLTDEPFTKDDIITIQDPNKLDAKVLSEFDHVKHDTKLDDEDAKKLAEDPTFNINMSEDTKRMMRELGTQNGRDAALMGGGGSKAQKERAAAFATLEAARQRIIDQDGPQKEAPALSIVDAASASVHGRSAEAAKAGSAEKTAARVAAHALGEIVPLNTKLVKSRYTSGAASRGLTSTTYTPVTTNDFEYVKAEKNPKKKGYVRLHSTHGDLNLELHCDICPRTCENFLTHCENGYYDNQIFHRNIRNFMIQGGDPTGTGRGGESIWGKPFKDEVNSKLLHSERGILSMANSGPHSNGSQFFILYKSAPHLNYKHTVFGRVVGGLETLSKTEKVPVDDDDKPLEDIKILKISVFVNPYTEPDEEEVKLKESSETAENEAENEKMGSWFSNPSMRPAIEGGRTGVGKYLSSFRKVDTANVNLESIEVSEHKRQKVVPRSGTELKNFSSW
ncbi:peptidyl-prolyl cis-trans isomerase-like 2 [Marchantia polymorpha subsp. ruderalis]|uniref:Uncharacterized protein n=2 Tax=Marchantia polymorpha TaxID=3197 RepID=A0A176WKM7_MARPO|nr:hypothetical protein AXG93_4773s1570 [Marchantia polymorpha subsp. ruderalis]PTQ48650.1 hypothetical protein MARPO_0005s0265 [Marchantia polymorpha]BBM97156.1 hypothetical protein Mp_1g03420 [Marchantia polymorpha subsp. ruderalis]|eukprot:PTQ48650.1 hypothetical protein MARPO_0005s0265 [Marchantia polymorpha]